MRHKKFTFKIGRTSAHRSALLANQVCSLISGTEIRTTVVKAKQTRRLADQMVTLGKKGRLHHRRQAIAKLGNETAVVKLFDVIAPKYTGREGGYTRIIRLGQRIGDAAEMCILQWVEQDFKKRASRPKKTNTIETAKSPSDSTDAVSAPAEAAPAAV